MTIAEINKQAASLTEKTISRYEKKLAAEYRAALAEQTKALQAVYAQLAGVDPKDYFNVMTKYNRLQGVVAGLQAEYSKLKKGVGKLTAKSSADTLAESYYRSQYATNWGLPSGVFVALNPAIIEASVYGTTKIWSKLRAEAKKKIEISRYLPQSGTLLEQLTTKYNAQGLRDIEALIRRSLMTGDSYAKTTRALRDLMGTDAYKAARIVRTESERNMTTGNMAMFDDLSETVPLKRMWVATLDDRTRDTHQALDGVIADDDGYFRAAGFETLGPGMSGDPAEDCNCRCSVIAVTDAAPTLRRARDPVTGRTDIISWASYPEWKAQHGV